MGNPWAETGDVDFNYDGALAACRAAWRAAENIPGNRDERRSAANVALAEWRGRYGDEFRDRVNAETGSLDDTTAYLKAFAHNLAYRWAEAMNMQSKRLRARAQQQHQDNRSTLDKMHDWVFGDDIFDPGPAKTYSPPQPPDFPSAAMPTYRT